MLLKFSTFGFSGSRSLSGAQFLLCSQLSQQVSKAGGTVACGCASGADAAARLGAGGHAIIFQAQSQQAHALVARSVRFVKFLAGSPNPVLLAFPNQVCPAGLAPSPFPSKCFNGLGSGTWASCALASGLGIPLMVYLSPPLMPPAGWGLWSRIQQGPFNGFWQLLPKQLGLF